MTLAKYANLGCGPLPLYPQDLKYMDIKTESDMDQWLLIDKYIVGPRVLNWDIEDLHQIPDDYLEKIFCSHALEHIPHTKVLDVLKLWYRKMVVGGTITVIVPDLMYAFKQLQIIEEGGNPEGLYKDLWGLHSPLSIIYGTQSQPGEYHLLGLTDLSLRYILKEAGFKDIQIETKFEDHQMDCLIATAQK
jgi:predicted SAM-dependent methyltransferase